MKMKWLKCALFSNNNASEERGGKAAQHGGKQSTKVRERELRERESETEREVRAANVGQ